MKIEVRHPTDRKHWTSEILLPGDSRELDGIGFRCPIEALYEDVVWEEPEDGHLE